MITPRNFEVAMLQGDSFERPPEVKSCQVHLFIINNQLLSSSGREAILDFQRTIMKSQACRTQTIFRMHQLNSRSTQARFNLTDLNLLFKSTCSAILATQDVSKRTKEEGRARCARRDRRGALVVETRLPDLVLPR